MAKAKITFATVAYVQCDKPMLNALKMSFNHWGDGAESVCIDIETLDAEVAEMDRKDARRAFLKSVIKRVSRKAGDIVFHL